MQATTTEVQKVSGTEAARPTSARDGALGPKIHRKGLSVPLVPDPKVVRELLTRYASLQIALAESEKPEGARELEDVSYTLCVMTGTRRVHDAIAAADALLVAGTERESVREPDGKHGLRWQSPLSEEAGTQRPAFPGQGAADL